MTLGIAVKCEDGILLACDSRSVYGRGVPIQRETNKIHYIEREGIAGGQVLILGAGTVAFIDKFLRLFRDTDLTSICEEIRQKNLHLSHIVNKIAEPLIRALFREYVEERKLSDLYSLSLILGGFERDKVAEAFVLWDIGLAEPVDGFSTIGSGAAYAELFLRYLLPAERKIEDVIKPVCYTIRLVESIDPYVGGKINIASIKHGGNIENLSEKVPEISVEKAKKLLDSAMNELRRGFNE